MSRRVRALAIALVLAAAAMGCVTPLAPRVPAFGISDVASDGDATRRASTRLVLRGIGADAAGDEARARATYQRALQVDATNPYAFLALARFEVERGDAERAASMIDQAETLLRIEEAPEGAMVHIRGLRGVLQARATGGRSRALADAESAAPVVWGDGRLDAQELR